MKIKLQRIILLVLGFIILYKIISLKSTIRNFKHSKNEVYQVIIMSSTRQALYKTFNETAPAVVTKLQNFLDNFVRYSKGTRINLNVVTSQKEIYIMRKTIEGVLENSSQITYEFKTLEEIQEKHDDIISRSKNFTGNEDEFSKAGDITFHLRLVYSKIFPYEKVIALDIDIEFRASFIELYNQFEKMNRQQIIGIAYNQNPYYRVMFRKYRIKNPKTRIGDYPPGYPGLSAGVMLLDLQKIRKSKEFNYHLTDSGFKYLCHKYNMTAIIGDQDFYTLLGAEYPHLFYILDCSFNRLMSSFLFNYPLFYKYYKCDEEIKIYHGNGNSGIPSEDFDP